MVYQVDQHKGNSLSSGVGSRRLAQLTRRGSKPKLFSNSLLVYFVLGILSFPRRLFLSVGTLCGTLLVAVSSEGILEPPYKSGKRHVSVDAIHQG